MCFLGENIQNGTLTYIWYPKKTKVIQVIVQFGSTNQSAWCDNIDLSILVAEPVWCKKIENKKSRKLSIRKIKSKRQIPKVQNLEKLKFRKVDIPKAKISKSSHSEN